MSDAAPTTPPGRVRSAPRFRAAITLGVVAMLITGSLAAVAGPSPERSSPVVATYVPVDGAVVFARQVSTTGGRSTSSVIMTESARISGSAVLNALDWNLATRLIGALGSDRELIDSTRFWRSITIPAVPAAAADAAAQTRVYTLDEDVALAAESGPGVGFSYLPNLVELPAGARAGQTWRTTGTAGAPTIRYTAEFAARAGTAGCLEVTGTVTYSVQDTSLKRELGRTWCAGGLVRETDDWVGTTVVRTADRAELRRAAAPPGGLAAPVTTEPVRSWTPAGWRAAQHEVKSVDPNFGEGPMAGAPASLPPVATRSGLVLQATASVPDIVAAGPDPAGTWRSRWRAHPGGQILTLSTFGDVAVATTSARTVVGYDSRGVRRWTLSTREVVRAQPIRVSAGDIAVAGLDGEVLAVELATGAVRWRSRVPGDVRLAPATTAGELVVADGSGTLSGLGLSDGTRRWTADVEAPVALTGAATALAVLSDSTVGSYDVATHDLLWRRWFPGTGRSVTLAGESIVVRAGDDVLAFDRDGARRWTRTGSDLSTDGRLLVVWAPERADVLDAGGSSLTSFSTPAETAGNPARHLAAADGVYRFDSTWTFSSWTDD